MQAMAAAPAVKEAPPLMMLAILEVKAEVVVVQVATVAMVGAEALVQLHHLLVH
jgi:hypothetical protein